MSVTKPPAFITFTGPDTGSLGDGMCRLSQEYPIEWGILIHPEFEGSPLFPDTENLDKLRRLGLRLCAHICGDPAVDIVNGRNPRVDLSGFARIQINHGRDGANERQVRETALYSARNGVRGVLQSVGEEFPESTDVDWLFDTSFGEGSEPGSYPIITTSLPFCGIAGGLGPNNVSEILEHQHTVEPDCDFWIDMESRVRTDNRFDLSKCEAVCRAVYG